ncbi:hypothetical protein NC653_003574 [Populus alba x Populus x berolinensis]|uniref:Uncharacterized protein n=1 Tax=Populus alba x Populus x berolinensis TaxID=444605 RepID=A0AAD6WKY2_9ROSI|nr:hypothetical protein NC653_003574 [Populus alba x Populus x berolinensis]
MSRPKRVWVGFRVQPKGIGFESSRVLPCLDPKGFRMGLESGHKGFGFGVSVWTQNRFGYKSFHFWAKQRLGDGSMVGPNGVKGGSVPKPNGVWVLSYWVWVLSCSDPI